MNIFQKNAKAYAELKEWNDRWNKKKANTQRLLGMVFMNNEDDEE